MREDADHKKNKSKQIKYKIGIWWIASQQERSHPASWGEDTQINK